SGNVHPAARHAADGAARDRLAESGGVHPARSACRRTAAGGAAELLSQSADAECSRDAAGVPAGNAAAVESNARHGATAGCAADVAAAVAVGAEWLDPADQLSGGRGIAAIWRSAV